MRSNKHTIARDRRDGANYLNGGNLEAVLANRGMVGIPDSPHFSIEIFCFPLWTWNRSLFFARKIDPSFFAHAEHLHILIDIINSQPFLIFVSSANFIKIYVGGNSKRFAHINPPMRLPIHKYGFYVRIIWILNRDRTGTQYFFLRINDLFIERSDRDIELYDRPGRIETAYGAIKKRFSVIIDVSIDSPGIVA